MRDTRQEILHFWFEETQPQQWFQKNDDFDQMIRDRFLVTYEMARDGLCDTWQKEAAGCLALCIVLDQFPRNMFRNSADAFATDDKARLVASHALAKGFDQVMPPVKRRFIYLPFEHSEDLEHQKKAVALFDSMKKDDPLGHEYALRHLAVIEEFGRFPHRNKVLGRENTQAEEEYLARPGAGF
ncbi:MAG: DUF924 domain-containing protein [Rhodospirillales bacterium]|nr:DUF924 domain-containing protein [Rhodospirillales bacterium]